MTTTTRVRATTGAALLVTRRRARLDVGLLVGTVVLLTATLVTVLAVPRLLERTALDALRHALATAGEDAAVVVPAPAPGWAPEGTVPLTAPEGAAALLDATLEGMHPAVAVATSDVRPTTVGDLQLRARLVTLATAAVRQDPVRWTAGRAPDVAPPPTDPTPAPDGTPTAPPPVVEVGMAAPVARTLGVAPADGPVTLTLTPPRGGDPIEAHVTGLFEPLDPTDARWAAAPDLLDVPERAAGAAVGLYVPPAARGDMAAALGSPLLSGAGVATMDLDGATPPDVDAVRRAVLTLSTSSPVRTGLPQVLTSYQAHLDATLAQAWLVLAGVGATAACCLVLAGALLVERRRTHLAGERARGASLASVALRAAAESVPTVLLSAGLAVLVVTWWLPGGSSAPLLPAAIAVVAVAAPVVLATRAAATAWAGRRVPTDRRERARREGLRAARRVVVELTAVAVAVAALVTLHGRGLVPRRDAGTDPLLTVAPFLLALSAALVVVRVAPAVVRVAARWAARSRGLAGTLAATRAQRGATALMPLVTVTVAVALVVLCGVLVQSVRDGQRVAADRLVGADVRLDGALDSAAAGDALARLAEADGVVAVATGAQTTDRAFGPGTEPRVTVLLVDAARLAQVRAASGLPVDDGLADLGATTDGRLPLLASAALLDRVEHADDTELQLLAGSVDAQVRGTTTLVGDLGAPPADVRATSWTDTGDDGVVVVDAAAAAGMTKRVPAVTRAWVAGPGAARAVADLGFAELPGVTVTTSDGWWSTWSSAPLPAALTRLLLAAVGALVLLAVVALALVVVATAGERGRTLSTLRTLGLDARTARWATLGELAPLVLGGFVGGSAIGLALPVLVGGTLGLTWVTGAPGDAAVQPTWWPVLVAAAALAAALTVAVAVEQAVRRHERLGEVLRVGAR